MIAVEVRHVARHGAIGVGYGTDPQGREVAIALYRGMADTLADDLAAGRRPTIEVESWALLSGLPGLREVVRV